MCDCINETHPALQLSRELGLEFADGTVTVVSLNKDLGGQRCTVTQLLKVVKLKRGAKYISNVSKGALMSTLLKLKMINGTVTRPVIGLAPCVYIILKKIHINHYC